jgi:hypothetical protein
MNEDKQDGHKHKQSNNSNATQNMDVTDSRSQLPIQQIRK